MKGRNISELVVYDHFNIQVYPNKVNVMTTMYVYKYKCILWIKHSCIIICTHRCTTSLDRTQALCSPALCSPVVTNFRISFFVSSPSQIAASLVLCTFMSAPIMYISARMVLVSYASDEQYSSIIEEAQRDVSFVTLICVVSAVCVYVHANNSWPPVIFPPTCQDTQPKHTFDWTFCPIKQ